MIYALSSKFDIERAKVYLNKLIDKGATVELCEVKKKRTLSQNALFHKWIHVFSEHIGEISFEYCKRDVKRTILGMRECVNRFTGEVQQIDYKTSQMTTSELSDFMTRFKTWANVEFGCYLPNPGDAGYDELITNYK